MTTKIAIVGEAWGREEAAFHAPFVGASGRLLTELLEEAGIERKECFLTNVFNLQPAPTNDVSNLCVTKADDTLGLPPLHSGTGPRYIDAKYWPEVERLYAELQEVKPNIIIACGNTPLWALTMKTGIGKFRGNVAASCEPAPPGLKLLPTYHPAALLRNEKLRAVVIADLMKAKRQSEFPEIRRPKREIWIEPNIMDLEKFFDLYLRDAQKISCDIETAGDQITCVGFAPSPDRAIVVPFTDNRKHDGSYWPTAHQEVMAWEFVRKVLALPCTKLGQNFLYDLNWLWRKMGIICKGDVDDTMLKHHAMQPESDKGLGFLGSIYTDEPAWKTMRGKGFFTLKRED